MANDRFESNTLSQEPPRDLLDTDPALYEYLRLQSETLREQTTDLFLGSSKYDWAKLTRLSAVREILLGSIGFFYHESGNIAKAVYCQLDHLAISAGGVPVGVKLLGGIAPWRLTDKLAESNPYLAVGLTCADIPADGIYYGWVQIDGLAVEQPIVNIVGITDGITSLAWTADNQLGAGAGRGLGFVGASTLVYCRQTDRTAEGILESIGEGLAPMAVELDSLADRVTLLEGIDGIAGLRTQINQLATDLAANFAADESGMTAVSNGINNLWTALNNLSSIVSTGTPSAAWISQVNNDLTGLAGNLASMSELLTGRINTLETTVAAFALGGLAAQIDAHTNQIAALTARITAAEASISGLGTPPRFYGMDFHADGGANCVLTSQANAEQNLGNNGRSQRYFDATDFTSVRLVAVAPTSSASVNSPRLYPQYSINAGSSWVTIGAGTVASGDAISLAITTAQKTNWIALPAGAKADVMWRVAQNGGNGALSPQVGHAEMQFK